MTTLANRATPAQHRIMRVIQGACINAGHAHPQAGMTPSFARSIAKRATGTLSALSPGVLAGQPVSMAIGKCPAGSQAVQTHPYCAAEGGGSLDKAPTALDQLRVLIRLSRRAGNREACRAYITAARIMMSGG